MSALSTLSTAQDQSPPSRAHPKYSALAPPNIPPLAEAVHNARTHAAAAVAAAHVAEQAIPRPLRSPRSIWLDSCAAWGRHPYLVAVDESWGRRPYLVAVDELGAHRWYNLVLGWGKQVYVVDRGGTRRRIMLVRRVLQ